MQLAWNVIIPQVLGQQARPQNLGHLRFIEGLHPFTGAHGLLEGSIHGRGTVADDPEGGRSSADHFPLQAHDPLVSAAGSPQKFKADEAPTDQTGLREANPH